MRAIGAPDLKRCDGALTVRWNVVSMILPAWRSLMSLNGPARPDGPTLIASEPAGPPTSAITQRPAPRYPSVFIPT
jgi:hypothetical protein